MSFEPKKFNEVFEEMRNRTSVITDFEVGSVARTMYESFSYEIALLYEKMRLVYLSAYVDTAQGQQLDMVVSVLGIKRGLPDFAEGDVTFERDVGNEDIEIPLGTLISTEDTSESPKKAYQTIEVKTLPKDHTSEDVKVQAINRGEEEVTEAETIVVMPRPIPGIKSVINQDATEFVGKKRETDEALRERAKNALISSGKATIIAIENALLSLPEVKDVKVNENFHFAQGKVQLQRTTELGEIIIPKGTCLTANTIKFETIELAKLEVGNDSAEVTVQALTEGKDGEVAKIGGDVAWTLEGNNGLETLIAANSEPILLGDFGIIEVYVDGINLKDSVEEQRIKDEINRVRAAGIFVILKSTTKMNIDGIFQIEINPDLKLSPEERIEFEASVKDEIVKYVKELKMGQPLLFSQIIKNTLSVEGLIDLVEFTITMHKEEENGNPLTFIASDRRIDIQAFEKFHPRNICVASEIKPLPVDIQFKFNRLEASKEAILNDLDKYFEGLKVGDIVENTKIYESSFSESGITLVEDTLKLTPVNWCPREPQVNGDIAVSFVEKAELGNLFAYHTCLDISGAIKLTVPTTMTSSEKEEKRETIRKNIEAYLNQLKSEEDIVLDNLMTIASGVDQILEVDFDWEDFRVEIDGVVVPGRVTEEKIEVDVFEKAQLKHVCITGDEEMVEISVKAVELDLLLPEPKPTNFDSMKEAIKPAIKNTIDNFLSEAKPGDDLNYELLKSSIENLVPGISYNVTSLTIEALSSCDGRVQETNVATKNLHVRSIELPVMQAFNVEDDIEIIEIEPPATENGSG